LTIIGVAGGSGSGKTTFSRMLSEVLGAPIVSLIAQDNYYIDQSAKFDHDGGSVNFDHPDSVDWSLLIEHLKMLKRGQPIEMPIYEYATHKRLERTIPVVPRRVVILDGILIFVNPRVRELLDYKIFINARESVRFDRRIQRDVAERGRSADGVRTQILTQVKPMHDLFVAPTLEYADQVISGESPFEEPIMEIIGRVVR